jgi:FkbM family methyltransferase
LESDPSLNFIDIGANLGTYSLSFAKLGRKVLSVDALNLNIEKLCSSVNQSHFEDRVYMIMNAISSRHETVSLAADDKNFGGTFIKFNDGSDSKNCAIVLIFPRSKLPVLIILLETHMSIFGLCT